MDRAAIIRFRDTSGRIIKSMIGRRHAVWVVTHQVGHNRSNATFFIIEHDWRATGCTGAQFQRPIWVLSIEWLTIQAVKVINNQITVIKKYDMGCVLPGNTLADRTVAGVVVDGIIIRVGVYMVAPSSILRHVPLLGTLLDQINCSSISRFSLGSNVILAEIICLCSSLFLALDGKFRRLKNRPPPCPERRWGPVMDLALMPQARPCGQGSPVKGRSRRWRDRGTRREISPRPSTKTC